MDTPEQLEAARRRRHFEETAQIEWKRQRARNGSIEDAAYVVWQGRFYQLWPDDPVRPLPPEVDIKTPGFFMLLPDGSHRRVAAEHAWPTPDCVRHRLKMLHPTATDREVDVAITQAEALETYAHAHCFDKGPDLRTTLKEMLPGFSARTIDQAVSDALAHMTQ